MTATAVVREFWHLMASNDFDSVAAVLAPGFVLEWPQSRDPAPANRGHLTEPLQ